MNHYKTLGLKPTATPAEVARAWRTKAELLHPDRPTGDRQAFEAARRAYDVLRDPKARARFDAELARASSGGGVSPTQQLVDEVLEPAVEHFGDMRAAARSRDFWGLAASTASLVSTCLTGVARTRTRPKAKP